ncbi:hypothetical protein PtA15_5A741 [Puccinia triticina]|uniref:Uncharacterized protein n=1 Tax=Puccinia triticina TaxID=208348 RepID=A0ABY7CR14_9BASI|nr:uncharacterized protein PtA15_5A741 [Puccinia triticina]WAQ85167.1 hypothetical protein PtA15_5A741 [Puccinia triticina]
MKIDFTFGRKDISALVWGKPDPPDLLDQPGSRAKDALSWYWSKHIPTAAMM